jgi:acyl carrier protein
MQSNVPDVQAYILSTIDELSRDWDYSEPVTTETGLFAQLGLESLDAVILATSIQEHYGTQMPFAQLFAEVGERQRDLTIGELVEFVQPHLQQAGNDRPPQTTTGGGNS